MYVTIFAHSPEAISLSRCMESAETAIVCNDLTPEDNIRIREAMEKCVLRIVDILDEYEISQREF